MLQCGVFFSEARVRQLSVFWSALLIGGIFISDSIRVLPSIGVAGLFLTGVGYSLGQRRIAQHARWPALLSMTLVYGLHLGWGLGQGRLADPALGQDLVLQLPFVLLPGAFWLLPAWRVAHVRTLWLLLLGCCLAAATHATVNYLRHYAEIDQLYAESRAMPTQPDHIRFSLLISMAVLAGAVLVFSQQLSARLRLATGVGIVLLFLFQHLLAARTGIITLYAGGILWLGWLGWRQRRWKALLLTIGLVAGLGYACLHLFPTLQNKIGNTLFDADQLTSADAANHMPVTGRLFSYEVAWAIIRRHPVAGVGKVGLGEAVAWQYGYQFPKIEPDHYLLPHNQFLYNLAAYGVAGLLVFLLGFYYLLWVGLRERNILLLLMYLIVSISFLAEYTLESQIGVLTGLFFILLAAAPIEEEVV